METVEFLEIDEVKKKFTCKISGNFFLSKYKAPTYTSWRVGVEFETIKQINEKIEMFYPYLKMPEYSKSKTGEFYRLGNIWVFLPENQKVRISGDKEALRAITLTFSEYKKGEKSYLNIYCDDFKIPEPPEAEDLPF